MLMNVIHESSDIYLDVLIVEHATSGVFELRVYKPAINVESEPLFVSKSALLEMIDEEDVAILVRNITEPFLTRGEVPNEASIAVQAYNDALAELIINRLHIEEYCVRNKLLIVAVVNTEMDTQRGWSHMNCGRPEGLISHTWIHNHQKSDQEINDSFEGMSMLTVRERWRVALVSDKVARGIHLNASDTKIWNTVLVHLQQTQEEDNTLSALNGGPTLNQQQKTNVCRSNAVHGLRSHGIAHSLGNSLASVQVNSMDSTSKYNRAAAGFDLEGSIESVPNVRASSFHTHSAANHVPSVDASWRTNYPLFATSQHNERGRRGSFLQQQPPPLQHQQQDAEDVTSKPHDKVEKTPLPPTNCDNANEALVAARALRALIAIGTAVGSTLQKTFSGGTRKVQPGGNSPAKANSTAEDRLKPQPAAADSPGRGARSITFALITPWKSKTFVQPKAVVSATTSPSATTTSTSSNSSTKLSSSQQSPDGGKTVTTTVSSRSKNSGKSGFLGKTLGSIRVLLF